MDLLERAHRWLADQLKAHVSQEVVYRRGADSTVVSATIARRVFSVAQGDTVLYIRGQDFLVKCEDLVLAGMSVLPERADEIDATLGAETRTFVVLPDEGFPPWEYADPYQQMFRIHAKHLED
jgi:hypothetical protein